MTEFQTPNKTEQRAADALLRELASSPEPWQRSVAWARRLPQLGKAAGSDERLVQLMAWVLESWATAVHEKGATHAATEQ